MKAFSVIAGKLQGISFFEGAHEICISRRPNRQYRFSLVPMLLVPASLRSRWHAKWILLALFAGGGPVRQQNAKPSFAETKMSEQHFRRVTEPELSRSHSLSFKRLQLLTTFSATGNCSVPSSFSLLPVSRSAVCLRLALSL